MNNKQMKEGVLYANVYSSCTKNNAKWLFSFVVVYPIYDVVSCNQKFYPAILTLLLIFAITTKNCPVGWGCRIHQMLLCRGGKKPPLHHECPRFDTKQSDGGVPVILELWGMQSTPAFPSLPGLLCLRVVAPDRVLSIGQIGLSREFLLNWTVWNKTIFKLN